MPAPAHKRRVEHVKPEWLDHQGQEIRERLGSLIQSDALSRLDPSNHSACLPIEAPQRTGLQNLMADETPIRRCLKAVSADVAVKSGFGCGTKERPRCSGNDLDIYVCAIRSLRDRRQM